jgi:predicted nuclease of predicted toxin-antitoxin system
VKFLVDNQLPAALTRFLTAQGEEAHHVLDLGLAQVTDAEIWRHAMENRMVLVSKDEDFFHLAGRREENAQLIWIRLGNCRTPALLSVLKKAWPRVRACLEAGDRVIEIR